MAFPGCGGSGSAEEPPTTIKAGVKAPEISLPPGPPPRRLIVNDLRPGSGPGIPPRREIAIKANYTSISYRTKEMYEVKWSREGAFVIPFGPKLEVEGWEKGLIGMKAGGRRELRVPSHMAYDEGAIVYLIDLLDWKPISSRAQAYSWK